LSQSTKLFKEGLKHLNNSSRTTPDLDKAFNAFNSVELPAHEFMRVGVLLDIAMTYIGRMATEDLGGDQCLSRNELTLVRELTLSGGLFMKYVMEMAAHIRSCDKLITEEQRKTTSTIIPVPSSSNQGDRFDDTFEYSSGSETIN